LCAAVDDTVGFDDARAAHSDERRQTQPSSPAPGVAFAGSPIFTLSIFGSAIQARGRPGEHRASNIAIATRFRDPGHLPQPPGPGSRGAGSSPRGAGRNVATATHSRFSPDGSVPSLPAKLIEKNHYHQCEHLRGPPRPRPPIEDVTPRAARPQRGVQDIETGEDPSASAHGASSLWSKVSRTEWRQS
jgi:hypothetical protein